MSRRAGSKSETGRRRRYDRLPAEGHAQLEEHLRAEIEGLAEAFLVAVERRGLDLNGAVRSPRAG